MRFHFTANKIIDARHRLLEKPSHSFLSWRNGSNFSAKELESLDKRLTKSVRYSMPPKLRLLRREDTMRVGQRQIRHLRNW